MRSTDRALDEKITTRELAAELRVTDQTIRQWRCDGRGPRYIKLTGNRVLYRRIDVEEFLAERLFDSTNDEATVAAQSCASKSAA